MTLRSWCKRYPRVALSLVYAVIPLLFVQVVWDSLCALRGGACESWADNWRVFRATRDDVREAIRNIRRV